MTGECEPAVVTDRDGPARAAAARALGLEVSRARYLRTLGRVRRCERVARVLGGLGPLAPVLLVRSDPESADAPDDQAEATGDEERGFEFGVAPDGDGPAPERD